MFANAGASIDSGGFLPPFLIGRGVSGTITTLVGIGIIIIMPELVAEMKKAVGVKGGIFEQLGKAMVTNFGQGAPIGAGIAGAPIGAGLGAIGGAAGEGWRNKKKLLTNPGDFVRDMGMGAGRGLVFGASGGIRRGVSLGKSAGHTPGWLGFAEKAVEGTGQHLSEEATLKRIENRQNFFGRSEKGSDGKERRSYQAKRELAEGRAMANDAKYERERQGVPEHVVQVDK